MILENAPALAIGIPLFAAFAVFFFGKLGKEAMKAWVVAGLLAAEILIIWLTMDAVSGISHFYAVGAQIPSIISPAGFPIRIVLVADAVSTLVALVAMSACLLAALFSFSFLKGKNAGGKFYSLLLLLAAGLVGLSFTGDFFTMFVFLEVVSISSAGLIAFFREEEGFEAAFKYLVLSSIGALLFLFGVGMLYGKYGLINIGAIAALVAVEASFIDFAAVALIASALLLKCGSFPVHMWKPDVYQKANGIVSAMLVASGLVGVYVLFRILFLMLANTPLSAMIGWVIAIFGMLSIFIGVTMALKQGSLKRLVGYAAVAETGFVLLALGIGLAAVITKDVFSFKAVVGGMFQLVNDALNLGLLFLVITAVAFVTKKKKVGEVSGLAHKSPVLAVLFLIGLLAISGMPPLNGFASKIIIYESVYMASPVFSIVGILGSIMLLAIFVKVFVAIFLGPPYKGTVEPLPKNMLLVMAIIAFFILFLGLFPKQAIEIVFLPAANALINSQAYIGGIL